MSAAMLFLMNYQFWGTALHEWAGIGIFVLFIAHHILNIGWYKSLFRGRYTPMRIFQIAVDFFTLISMLLLMYSSVFVSQHIFTFLSIQKGMAIARRLHILGSFWGFVLMSLHLGMHWNMVIGSLNRRFCGKKYRTVKIMLFAIGLAVAIVGVWVFISQSYTDYLFLKSEFIMIDSSISAPLNFLQSAEVSGLLVFLTHYSFKILRKLPSQRKETHK